MDPFNSLVLQKPEKQSFQMTIHQRREEGKVFCSSNDSTWRLRLNDFHGKHLNRR